MFISTNIILAFQNNELDGIFLTLCVEKRLNFPNWYDNWKTKYTISLYTK